MGTFGHVHGTLATYVQYLNTGPTICHEDQMARLREFDETHALDAVQQLFWRFGFEGTSYADLMEATGLGKGSLYSAFGDKRSLYLKALEAYIAKEVDGAVDLIDGAGDTAPGSSRKRIKAYLDIVIDAVAVHADRRGCFLCNAAVDLAPEDKQVEDTVTQALGRMTNALVRALAQEGLAKPRQRQLANALTSTYLGMRVMAKAGVPVPQLRSVRDAALAQI